MPIEITVPGSKSITNRALLLKALGNLDTKIIGGAICDDTKYMEEGLKDLKEGKSKIYTGNAGTATRFLTAYATLLNREITITGNERMCKRPIQPLADALNQIGAKVETTNGCPPITIYPQKPTGGTIRIPGNISSQYISALLMINAHDKLEIEGELCSKPYIEMTKKMIKEFSLKPVKYEVEGDASSASYLGAFAALTPDKPVKLTNIKRTSIQGDIAFLDYLEKMGCTIKDGTIQGPDELKTLGEVDMNSTPDLVMTFAVLAMFAQGTTKITNIENLRIKETDRLEALKNELKKFGTKVKTTRESIEITGPIAPQSQKVHIETYDDHRIAMSFGILENVVLKDPECVKKSYPTFWEDIRKLRK